MASGNIVRLSRPSPRADTDSGLWLCYHDADGNPDLIALCDALRNKYDWIVAEIRRELRDDGRIAEFVEKVYRRMKARLTSIQCLEAAVCSGLYWAVQQDHTSAKRRRAIVGQLPSRDIADPRSVEFVLHLLYQGEMDALCSCMDGETREIFEAVFILKRDRSRVAAERGMKRNTLDQKLRRGVESAASTYQRLYARQK